MDKIENVDDYYNDEDYNENEDDEYNDHVVDPAANAKDTKNITILGLLPNLSVLFSKFKIFKINSFADEICSLPLSVGNCRASIPKFYYDAKSKKCSSFQYSG